MWVLVYAAKKVGKCYPQVFKATIPFMASWYAGEAKYNQSAVLAESVAPKHGQEAGGGGVLSLCMAVIV